MVITSILFSFLYAVILTAVFSLIFRNTGPWNGFWIFFFLLFFTALGAGEWAAPVGPIAWGYYWAPGLFAAIIFALVLAAAATPVSRSSRKLNNKSNIRQKITSEEVYEEGAAAEATRTIGIFFWILMLVLIIVAISGVRFS